MTQHSVNRVVAARSLCTSPNQLGLTLIELLVSLSIVCLLVSGMSSSFKNMITRHQITTDTNSMISYINLARQQAVKQRQTMILCPSSDTVSCNSRDWTGPIMVFPDLNNNKRRDPNEKILVNPTIDSNTKISWRGSHRAKYLRFDQYGRALTFGSFYLCSDPNSKIVKRLVVSRTGRPQLHRDFDGDGISDSVTNISKSCGTATT